MYTLTKNQKKIEYFLNTDIYKQCCQVVSIKYTTQIIKSVNLINFVIKL